MSNPNTPDGNHEFERKDVLFGAQPVVGDDNIDCEIVNISLGGAQVHASRTMKAGQRLLLKLTLSVSSPWKSGGARNRMSGSSSTKTQQKWRNWSWPPPPMPQ